MIMSQCGRGLRVGGLRLQHAINFWLIFFVCFAFYKEAFYFICAFHKFIKYRVQVSSSKLHFSFPFKSLLAKFLYRLTHHKPWFNVVKTKLSFLFFFPRGF